MLDDREARMHWLRQLAVMERKYLLTILMRFRAPSTEAGACMFVSSLLLSSRALDGSVAQSRHSCRHPLLQSWWSLATN
jgi:hypothetical protein